MKLSRITATLLLAAGVFVMTPPLHAQTNTPTNGAVRGPRGGRGPEGRTLYLSQQLNLTADQKPKVQAVLEQEAKAMQDIPREERREKMTAVHEETSKKLKVILTEEQYAKYQALPQPGQGRRPTPAPGQPGAEVKKTETPKP
jgi:Spy/CpxP family protein refolding chaperone